MEYRLEDLIDIPLLQILLDKLNEFYSFPSAIIDKEGKILTATAWQDVCTKFHRVNKESELECIKSDQYISDHLSEANPAISYNCPHGMVDNAVPIFINNKHIANFFTGQLFLNKPDLDFFIDQAKKYDFDKDSYIEAVEKIPVWTKEKLDKYIDFIKSFTEIMAEMGYKNLKEIENRKLLEQKEKELKESEQLLRKAFETSLIGMALLSIKREFLQVNSSLCNTIGYSNEELLNKTLEQISYPEDLQADLDLFQKLLNGEISSYQIEKRYYHKNGSIVWTNNSIALINDENGEPCYFILQSENITKPKQAEEELKSEQYLVRALMNNIPANIYFKDKQSHFIRVNNALSKLFGLDNPEKIIGKTDFDFFSNEHAQQAFEDEQEIISKGITIKKEEKETWPHHPDTWVSSVKMPLCDNNNNIIGSFGISLDITEQKLAEEKLQESEAKLNIAADNLNGILWVLNKDLKYTVLKGKALNIVGLDPNQVIGTSIYDFYRTNDPENPLIKAHLLALNGESETIETTSQDITFSSTISPIKNLSGNVTGVIGLAINITDRKIAEKKLKEQNEEYEAINEELKESNQKLLMAKEKAEESEEKYKNVVIDLDKAQSYSKVGSWKWYIQENQLEWSKEMYHIFGIDEKTFTGKLEEVIEKSIHPDDKKAVNESNQSVVEKGIPIPLEYRIIQPDGSIKVLWAEAGELIKDNDSNPLTLSGIVQDITERKRSEEQLLIAKEKAEESDLLKSAFLQNMSHEIRTPMNAILGFSNMLDSFDLSKEKQKTYISIIKSSSNQLLSVVTDILTISSLETNQESLKLGNTYINSLLLDLFNIFKTQASEKYISIFMKTGFHDHESEAYIDATKLTQILSNLISNALKFTEKGSIEFGYEKIDESVDTMHALYLLRFFVKDTGIGIRPELHEKIFQRFRQADISINRKYGGTGLGLSISKGFVELMGGKIWVESEPGVGSCFYFTIPYTTAIADKNHNKTKFQPKTLNKILIAEDEINNFLYIQELLDDMNFQLFHAQNGLEAIEICKANSDIELILMDIKMPEMDGYTAALKIRELRPSIIIIAQTAYALQVEKEKYKDAFEDYITKPINADELKQKLSKYILQ